jgi:hypothetical protein
MLREDTLAAAHGQDMLSVTLNRLLLPIPVDTVVSLLERYTTVTRFPVSPP